MSFTLHIFLFFIYSFLGWLMEVIVGYIYRKKIVNRGFMVGPYCPIYGFGGTLITLVLNAYANNPVVLFCVAIVICGLLEYFTSYIMEKIFKARWWDYSQKKYNINGRVCLETIIPFGLLGCLIIYAINPISITILSRISSNIQDGIAIALVSIFVIDFIISFFVISKIRKTVKNINKDSVEDDTEEITKKVKAEILQGKDVLVRRLIEAFPKFSIDDVKKRIKEKTEHVKENVSRVKEGATEKIKEGAVKVKEGAEKVKQTTIKVRDEAAEKVKQTTIKVKEGAAEKVKQTTAKVKGSTTGKGKKTIVKDRDNSGRK